MPSKTRTGDDRLLEVDEPDIVYPSGDVILVVDNGSLPAIRLEVSSFVLSMNSDVFKALFSQRYAEGQTKPGQGRKEITVHDHPDGMRLLCRMLHCAPLHAKKGHPQLNVLELAIAADKYACTERISLQARALLDLARLTDEEISSCWYQNKSHQHDLVAAAFILGQRDPFRSLSAELVLKSGSISSKDFSPQALDFLPERVISSLKAQQAAAMGNFSYEIGVLTEAFSTSAEFYNFGHLVPRFITELSRAHIFPIHHGMYRLDSLLSKLQSVSVPIFKPEYSKCICSMIDREMGLQESEQENSNEFEYKSVGGRQLWHSKLCATIDSDEDLSDHYCEELGHTVVKQTHVLAAAEIVRGICVGACWDCCKNGEDSCEAIHPNPWLREVKKEYLYLDPYDRWSSRRDERSKPKWWEGLW